MRAEGLHTFVIGLLISTLILGVLLLSLHQLWEGSRKGIQARPAYSEPVYCRHADSGLPTMNEFEGGQTRISPAVTC